jgi:hypothetical protein
LYEGPEIDKFLETESRVDVARVWEREWLMGTEFLFGMIRKFQH